MAAVKITPEKSKPGWTVTVQWGLQGNEPKWQFAAQQHEGSAGLDQKIKKMSMSMAPLSCEALRAT